MEIVEKGLGTTEITLPVKFKAIPTRKDEAFDRLKWELNEKAWSKVIESLAGLMVMTTKHWKALMK